MPRALTEREKCLQCKRLLEKGKDAVFSYGIKKVSVDDIARAAGMAKGTFYQHFDSKEKYLYTLIENIHHETFAQAERIILNDLSEGKNLRDTVRSFLEKLFYMPAMVFFVQNEHEITMVLETVPDQELRSFKQIEESLFEGLLRICGIDTNKVKPGVVHNFIHALFIIKGSDLMAGDDLQETLDMIMDGLISYIIGGSV